VQVSLQDRGAAHEIRRLSGPMMLDQVSRSGWSLGVTLEAA